MASKETTSFKCFHVIQRNNLDNYIIHPSDSLLKKIKISEHAGMNKPKGHNDSIMRGSTDEAAKTESEAKKGFLYLHPITSMQTNCLVCVAVIAGVKPTLNRGYFLQELTLIDQ